MHETIWYPEEHSTEDTIIKYLLTGTTEQCADAGWCVLLPCALLLLVLAVFANSFCFHLDGGCSCRMGAAVLKGLHKVMKEHDISDFFVHLQTARLALDCPSNIASDFKAEKKAAYLSEQKDMATEMGINFEANMLLALQEKGKRGIKSTQRALVKPVMEQIGVHSTPLCSYLHPIPLYIPFPCALIHPTPLCFVSTAHLTPLCTVGMIMDGVETGMMDLFDALRYTSMLFMFRCVRPDDKGGYDLEFTGEEKPFVSSKNLFRDFLRYLMARCVTLNYKAFEEVLTGPFMENGMSCVLALSSVLILTPACIDRGLHRVVPCRLRHHLRQVVRHGVPQGCQRGHGRKRQDTS